MHTWYQAGFFPENLLVRKLTDQPTQFQPLHLLVQIAGPERPFAYINPVKPVAPGPSPPAFPPQALVGGWPTGNSVAAPGNPISPSRNSGWNDARQSPSHSASNSLVGSRDHSPVGDEAFAALRLDAGKDLENDRVSDHVENQRPVSDRSGPGRLNSHGSASSRGSPARLNTSEAASPVFQATEKSASPLTSPLSKSVAPRNGKASSPSVVSPGSANHRSPTIEPTAPPKAPVAAPPPEKTPWATESTTQPSLRSIQQDEAKMTAARNLEREKLASELVRLEAMSIAHRDTSSSRWGTDGSQANGESRKSNETLAQIMAREERAKSELARARGEAVAAASRGWSRVAASNVSGQPPQSASRLPPPIEAARGAVNPSQQWKVVENSKSRFAAVDFNAYRSGISPVLKAKPGPVAAAQQKAESDANWCRSYLSAISSPAFNGTFPCSHNGLANMFIEMLMEIDPSSNSSMIHTICDDTLGGFHAVDANKFAREFIRQRQSVDKTASPAFPRQPEKPGRFETPNQFEVVQKKKKKKGKK